ncbi:MAG: ATP-binding protein [Symbiobacteriia bacterium]
MTSFPWWARFKGRMLAFGVTMSILPVLALGYFSLQAVWQGQLELMAQRNHAVAATVADDLARLISRIEDRLSTAARTENEALLTAPAAEQQRLLYTILRDAPYLEELAIVSGDGRELARVSRRQLTTAADPREPLDPAGAAPVAGPDTRVIRALAEGRPTVGLVHIWEDGRPMLNLAVPAQSRAGGTLPGGLVAQVSLRGVLDNLASIREARGTDVLVVDGDGRLIGHSDFSQVLLGRDVTANQAVRQFLVGADPKDATLPNRYRSHTGQDVVGVFHPVAGLGWGVIVEEPTSSALGPVREMAGRIGIIGLAIMALVVGLSVYFAGRVTRPIEVLEEGARRVGTGDLEHVIEADSPDEIGRLVAEFNRMTARLRAQSANLQREKERLDLVVSGIGAGLALIDERGNTLWVNRTLSEWLPDGFLPLGRPCYEVLGRHDCPVDPAACSPGEMVRTERVGGHERILRHRSFALEGGGQGEPRFLEVVEDITQQRAMEAMVVQADKLAALGQLAAGVAHEINNPLASVSAYAEDLSDRLREEGPAALIASGSAQSYLEIIRQQVERVKGITANLLRFARQAPPADRESLESVSVNDVLRDTVALVGHRIRRQQVEVRWQLTEGIPFVRAESARLQQVVLNLLTNALDAMDPGGGSLTLETRATADGVMLRVGDTGQGIRPADQARVFEPFYTTKPPGKGTGLGLSICYGIVSEWGGRLTLESEPQSGTTFTVTLPPETGPKGSPQPPQTRSRKGETA